MSRLLALLSAPVLLAPALFAVPPAEAAPLRTPESLGVWVWSLQPPIPLRDFVRAAGVTEVFLATPTSPTGDEARQVRRTVRLLHDDGVRVSALGGDPAWVRHHDWALDWAQSALATADFDGLHLDVEPHALPGWQDPPTRRDLVRRYLALLDEVRPLHDRLVVDVQFAYGSVDAPSGTFADAILRRVDEVTVMSYRDTARGSNSLLAVSRDWRVRGERAGVPVRLAVETNPSTEGEHVTFAEEGERAMLRVLRAVDDRLRGTATYAGFAVHDLDGWQALAP